MKAKPPEDECSHPRASTRQAGLRNARPTIGVLLPDVYLGNNESFWLGAMDAARAVDVNLICLAGGFVRYPGEFGSQANILYELAGPQALDGLVIWSGTLGWYILGDELTHFFQRYAPLPRVSVEEVIPGVPCVSKDNYHGMREAIVHLIEVHGYRRIAFLRGLQGVLWAEDRYRAYQETLTAYDLSLDSALVVTPPCGWFESTLGERTISILLDERQVEFDAIVSVSDYQTRHVVKALQTRGLNVPGDVAVIGFDDEQESAVMTPPLTTVRNPMYDMSWQAVEVVVAQLRGKEVPSQIILPTTLVVRQSCGCQSPIILQAAVGSVPRPAMPANSTLKGQRQEILLKLEHVFETVSADKRLDWPERFLDAFLEELSEEDSGQFLATFEAILGHGPLTEKDIGVWHQALSTLRHGVLPYVNEHEPGKADRDRAEDLWQQARTLLGEAARRMEAARKVQAELQARRLREISTRLITTFEVNALMDILAETLPQIGIPRCFLALYEAPDAYAYPQPAPEWARLILSYTEHGRICREPDEQRFPAGSIVPTEFLAQEQGYSLLVEPLYFRDHQLGFVVFEVGFREGHMYEALRAEISSALQGALLVERIQEHAAELSQKNYILDTFMETVPDSIYFKDREGRITRANTAHARRLGCAHPDQELGKTDFDFFPEDQARLKFQQEQEIIRTGQPLLAIEETDSQGRWVLTTKMPLRNEHAEIIGTFGISRNITDLKKTEHELVRHRQHLEELIAERTAEITQINACLRDEIVERTRIEEALRQSEQQYRLLAENVQDGIIIVQAGRIVFGNEVFASMTGYAADALFHQEPGTLFPAQVLSDNAEVSNAPFQVELTTHDGQTIWTEIECSPIVWNTQPARLFTVRNIHHRKLRELRLEEERTRLRQENLLFKSTLTGRYRFGQLIGKSEAMQRVYEAVISAAMSGVNVLVYGESGTGKELIARTIHQVSPRKDRPFVAVNCASIPEPLFEREFFGHRKGAFTGADRDHPGLFDRAHRGILFLDEVTELSSGLQAKLLRVLQDGEYVPLGQNTPKQADVVIVAATNTDPRQEIRQGRLRQDFFYRIGVIEITSPPLRGRKEDLPLLIEHIAAAYQRKQARNSGTSRREPPFEQTRLPAELVQALYSYAWPGNVRELQNVLQRYLATGRLEAVLSILAQPDQPRSLPSISADSESQSLHEKIEAFEREAIADMLARNHYHIAQTAESLQVPLRTLQRKIRHYRLRKKDYKKH